MDHWNLGEAQKALATRSWDVVVMQQGPSALPESQVNLRAWAMRFADEARSRGTRPALLTVWPESNRQSALSDVILSYRRAAGAAGAELLPAGVAWQEAWRCDRRVPLYGGDGFHPSPLGTYATALVVYGRLFQGSAADAEARARRRAGPHVAAAAGDRRERPGSDRPQGPTLRSLAQEAARVVLGP